MIKHISVVMIVKNGERTIEKSLDSLLDFEDIVVYDNGSTDSTLSLVKKYDNVNLIQGDFAGFGETKKKATLEEIIATETGNDFITFEIKDVSPIAVAQKYAGIGASLVARIKNTKTPFGIDFGVGDVIVPKQEKRKIPTQLDDFAAPMVNTYSLETTVAEKLDAILSLMEFSSRMKDYYDLSYLANKFDFDGATLAEALKKTFENRGHHFTVGQFEQVMTFGSDDAMQKKWKAFCRKIDTKAEELALLNRNVLYVRQFTIAAFREILKFIENNILPFINDKNTSGQDLLNLFFVTFNKYVGKSDKNQALARKN